MRKLIKPKAALGAASVNVCHDWKAVMYHYHYNNKIFTKNLCVSQNKWSHENVMLFILDILLFFLMSIIVFLFQSSYLNPTLIACLGKLIVFVRRTQ